MKACPFCAEQIQDAAVKCRYCGSMLDGSRPEDEGHERAAALLPAKVLFDGTPSWKIWFWWYVFAWISVVGILALPLLQLGRKSIRYKITNRTIDYESGLLSKRVETLQLWRVRDLDYRQSLFDRMLGIARIHVFTKDVTDPQLVLRGLPPSRQLFDELKDAAELVRQQRVVGVVE